MSRTTKLIIGSAVALVAAWLFATPYLSVRAMRAAAMERDAEGINSRVDFPALKENIKNQFSAKMLAETASAPQDDNPFAGAGAALGMMMIGPMVDRLITPEAISMMMRGQKPAGEDTKAEDGAAADNVDPTMGYRDLNTFAVRVRDKAKPEAEELVLLFKRHGLASWKLSAVELPL